MIAPIVATVQRMLAPVHRRLMNLLSRGVVSAVDDSKKLQLVQLDLLDTETRDEIERFQNYGFTSVPEAGAESVVLFVGGRRDHGLAIVVDDRRYRLKSLAEGEVAVYNRTGAKIVLKANGDIELTPKSGQKVKLASPVEISGDVSVTGTLTASADVVGGGKSLKNHIHSANLSVSTTGTAAAQTGTATGNTAAPT